MNSEEIIRKFINMGRAIYMTVLMTEESEGNEVPDSITVSAEVTDGKIIEITIAIKEGDTKCQ